MQHDVTYADRTSVVSLALICASQRLQRLAPAWAATEQLLLSARNCSFVSRTLQLRRSAQNCVVLCAEQLVGGVAQSMFR
jgi:hypothetical protein